MAQWRSLPRQLDKRQANNFQDGLNTETSPFFVSENTLIDGHGWDFDEHPALKVRKGRVAHGASGDGMTRLLTNFGHQHLVRAVGTSLQYNSSGTTWDDIPGTFEDTDWDAANFDINGPALVLTNGTDICRYWDGTTLSNITDMPKGKYVAADNRRVYTAGVDDEEDVIFYCAFQDALDWSSELNSGAVQFYTANGGGITGLHSYAGRIWAFKKDAFCIIFHTGDSRSTHRLVEVSNNIGCVSYKTIKEVGELLIWLGETDVYVGAGGEASPIGGAIKRFLDDINPAAVGNSFAFTQNRKYYLCIPTGANEQPDTCLVYDTRTRNWTVYDVQLGGMRFGANLNTQAYTGDAEGLTIHMNVGDKDFDKDIPWMVRSRPFDEGMKEAEKELWEMHLQGYFPSGSTLTVEVAPDDVGSVWHEIAYDPIGTSGATQNKNLIVPLDTVPLCHFYCYRLRGTGPVTIQEVQRYSRIQPVQY